MELFKVAFISKLTTYLMIVLHRIWKVCSFYKLFYRSSRNGSWSLNPPVFKQLLDKYFNSKCLPIDLVDPITLYNISNIATTTVTFLSKQVRMLGYKREMASDVYNVAFPSLRCKNCIVTFFAKHFSIVRLITLTFTGVNMNNDEWRIFIL